MNALPTIIPISDLRQDAANIIHTVKVNQEPAVITQRGRPSAVIIDFDSYEDLTQKIKLWAMFERAEREIAEGVGRTLDEVQVDIDRILSSS